MRKLLFLAAFSFSLTAHAQATPDANVNVNPEALDPAAKARIRAEGAAGGTGARIPPEARGPATVTDGRPNRRSVHKEQPAEMGVPPKVPQPLEREVLGPREK
jgi:hypothetical protein